MDYLPPRSVQGTKKLMEGHRKGRTKPSNLREQVDPETMKMYPTPTQDSASERTKKYKQGGTPLPLAVKIETMKDVEKHLRSKKQSFPTPTSFDSNEINKPRKPHPGGGQKPPLNQIVQMYPTPSASCNMDVVAPPETVKKNSTGWSVTRVGTGRVFGAKLNDVMNKIEKDKMFPTPKQRDYKDAAYQPTWKDSLEKNLPRTVLKDNKPGGRLNPTFVEFLMGFPMNWTKIDPTE
jgi:hypothetical protein